MLACEHLRSLFFRQVASSCAFESIIGWVTFGVLAKTEVPLPAGRCRSIKLLLSAILVLNIPFFAIPRPQLLVLRGGTRSAIHVKSFH